MQPFRLSVDKKYHILQLMLIKHTHVVFAASGLPHSFIIMHQNRYQQCIGAFILQAASESNKVDSPRPRGFVLAFPGRNSLKCEKRYRNVHTTLEFLHFWCPFPERMDVKARGRCDYTVETGLRPAESQELHPVVGVRTDMNHPHNTRESHLKILLSTCTALSRRRF